MIKRTPNPEKPQQTVHITCENIEIEDKTEDVIAKLRKLNAQIDKLNNLSTWDKKLREFKKKVYETKLKLQLKKVRCRCKLKHSALVVC